MLAIQPVSVKGYSKPAFTQRYDRDDSLESDRSFFEDQKAEINGAKVVKAAKKVAEKTKAFFKGMNIFKDEASYDKATKKTATVLGAGSGVASAYATAVKESELKEGEAE